MTLAELKKLYPVKATKSDDDRDVVIKIKKRMARLGDDGHYSVTLPDGTVAEVNRMFVDWM